MSTNTNTKAAKAARLTKTQQNHAAAREVLENGGVIVITTKWGRSDYNGNHVTARDQFGRKLGSASGGNYDLKAKAIWEACEGVMKPDTKQLTGSGSDEFGLIYANFSEWNYPRFFAQFGWNVKAENIGDCYIVTIRRAE